MLLCEPNVSEGRDHARIGRFTGAVAGAPGVQLLHTSSDPDHHRMVLAYRGGVEAVVAASAALATAVFDEVDLRVHEGQHPRIGALDVVPFVRGPGVTEAEAVAACRELGSWLGDLGVPVFLYERAAASPERRPLPRIRRGEFEGLRTKLQDPAWTPDFGPAEPHPALGATVVGLRDPLVRFNVNLDTTDPGPARRIATRVRASGGGLPHVRALGIALERRGLTQVSMNLTRYRTTSISTVFDRVRQEAAALGVALAGTELIGPVPAGALHGVDIERLDLHLEADQILELAEAGNGART